MLFSGFFQFKGNFVNGRNNSKYRDIAPLITRHYFLMICLSWKRICVQHEDMDEFWNDPESTLDFYELKDQHFATVDAVHITKSGDLCISGSRDRAVGVWSLNALTDPAKAGYSKKSFRQTLDGHRVGGISFHSTISYM